MVYFSFRSLSSASSRSRRPSSSLRFTARHSRRAGVLSIQTVRHKLLSAGVSSKTRAIYSNWRR